MANRMFNQFQGTLEKGVVQLFLKLTSNGAADPTVNRAKGVASVTRTGTGAWRVTLQDTYVALLSYSNGLDANTTPPNSGALVIAAETVSTDGIIDLQFYNNATTPAAVDPTSGDVVYVTLNLSNSTAL